MDIEIGKKKIILKLIKNKNPKNIIIISEEDNNSSE